MRIFIGISIGFIAWTILWLGSEPIIFSVVPEWNHGNDLSKVTENYLATKVVLSSGFSILAGYLCSVIGRENIRGPVSLGVVLLAVGLFVQLSVWDSVPVWFHSIFLGLLLPFTIIGGRIRKS